MYIDDILIFSRTLREHLTHLQQVIERVFEVGLKLKPMKCRFIQKELEYLGHIVSQEGLKPQPLSGGRSTRFPPANDSPGGTEILRPLLILPKI